MPKKPFSGKSKAFSIFTESLWRTKQLIDFGVVGIDTELENKIRPLLAKFEHVKGVVGRPPKHHEPFIKRADGSSKTIALEMDVRSAAMMKKTVEIHYKRHDDLRFFFYANLAVSLWAAFETYNAVLFEELFRIRHEMLKSSEQITIQDAVDNHTDLIEYLIERQLESIGHFKLKEMADYYKKKTGITISEVQYKKLELYYLVRNLIAHKNGVLRPRQKIRVSKDLRVVGDEVRVSKAFLLRMADTIENTIKLLEKQVCAKFFK